MSNPNINVWGATYNGVTGVTLPTSGGGTATFPWVEGSETKTQNGTYDVTNLAQLVVNVAGGGGGLTYETGTYTPSSDTAQPTISFSGTHSSPPWAICIAVDSSSFLAANSNLWWTYNSFYYGVGVDPFTSTSGHHYGVVRYGYRSSSSTSSGGSNLSALTGSNTSSLSYWVTSSAFMPSTGSTSRYYRAGYDYKWIAVWKPTS